jgi:D-erythronate 2-dehydrogenase
MPQSSYGAQKLIGELLVADYSRKGFIDGRSVRLPTIVVRPGKPNAAASSFASGIIREPLAGVDAVLSGRSADTSMWVAVAGGGDRAPACTRWNCSAERLGPVRGRINLPG